MEGSQKGLNTLYISGIENWVICTKYNNSNKLSLCSYHIRVIFQKLGKTIWCLEVHLVFSVLVGKSPVPTNIPDRYRHG